MTGTSIAAVIFLGLLILIALWARTIKNCPEGGEHDFGEITFDPYVGHIALCSKCKETILVSPLSVSD